MKKIQAIALKFSEVPVAVFQINDYDAT